MAKPAIARLQKELMEVIMSGTEGISAFPDNDNLCHWIAMITGVDNTPYEGLEFQLSIKFSEKYPFEAPVVTFLTPCFHPNVSVAGDLCLDILKENWTASYTALQILLSIQSLLETPNIHSPLNITAASLWKNREEYTKAVRATAQMDKLFYANTNLQDIRCRIDAAEEKLLASLEKGKSLEMIAPIEAEITALKEAADDAATIIQYYQMQGDMQRVSGIYRVLYQGIRGDNIVDQNDVAKFGVHVNSTYLSNGISSLLVVSSHIVFGIIEGKQQNVTEAFTALENCKEFSCIKRISAAFVESRVYALGLRSYTVLDDVLISVLEKCENIIDVGSRFAPKASLDISAKGGDPSGTVLCPTALYTVMSVTLDTFCGCSYSPSVYSEAASKLIATIQKGDGAIVEKFGEQMIVAFPRRGTLPSTSAVECAARLIFGDSIIKNIIIVLTIGQVTFVNQPHCIAFGKGIIDAHRLMMLAITNRRPFIMTPTVTEQCSKLVFKPKPFTINVVQYFTLQEIEDRRLGINTEPFVIEEIAGYTAVDVPGSNTIQYKKMSAKEVTEKMSRDYVQGGDAQTEELKKLFCLLDSANMNWIKKAVFKQWLLNGQTFVIFPHDTKKIDLWISQCNALGIDKLSQEEFVLLCLKIRQM